MKNTKKLIALMMAITLIVMAFAACTAKKPDEPKTTKPDTEATSDEATKAEEKTTVAPIEEPSTKESPTESEQSTKESPTESGKKSIKEVADDVLAGKYGSGEERKAKLKAEGYDPEEVQAEIAKREATPKTTEAPKPKQDTPKTTEAPKTTDAPKPTEAPKPKQEDKPTENQFGYFTASTGESIRYCKYIAHNNSTCTGVSESGGRIIISYDNCGNDEKFKCSNCGKYLCEGGCKPADDRCPFCGRTDCERYIADAECIFCGKPVKANTCHYCKQEDIDEYWK